MLWLLSFLFQVFVYVVVGVGIGNKILQVCLDSGQNSSLRKHPFLLALRRWGRFARNAPSGEERGETDVFAG